MPARSASLLFIPAVLAAAPAVAEPAREVSVAPSRLDQAIVALGRQTGASIGLRDLSLAGMPVRGVSGRLSAAKALDRLLAGMPLRARRVGINTFLIERTHEPKRSSRPELRTAVAGAPPRAEGEDEEILVTGTKRDVPLSAYAGTAEIIAGDSLTPAEAAEGTAAIQARLTTLSSTQLGPGRNKLFIRGIADSSFVGPTQSTVGQYWGNTRVTYSAPDPNLRLHDVRSVEVLEGPQGTLYGAGSLGGVMRVVPQSPRLDAIEARGWGGVQAIQHGDLGGDLGGLVNLPLFDGNAGLRVVGFGAVEGGYIDDRARGLDDINRVRTLGGRAAFRAEPGDGWTIDASALMQSIKGDDGQYADKAGDGLSRESVLDQPFRNDYLLSEATLSKRWGDLELVSAVSYVHQYVSERFEGMGMSIGGSVQPSPIDTSTPPVAPLVDAAYDQVGRIDMFSSETRLANRSENGAGWLIGASLLRNQASTARRIVIGRLFARLPGVRNRVDEATLYGEGTLVPRDGVAITLGGRLTYSRLSGDPEDLAIAVAFRNDPRAQASRVETRFMPSAAIVLRPWDRLSVFARYQESFRPGGLAVQRDFIRSFAGDRLSTAEFGLRFGGRRGDSFDATLTAAYTEWRDIQADIIDGLGFPTTVNIGDGQIYSLGVGARWRPAPGLEFDAAIHLNHSDVGDTWPGAYTVFLSTTSTPAELPNVADITGRFGVSYDAEIGPNLMLTTSAYGRYTGQSTLGVGPILGQTQGEFVDTGIQARIGDDRRGISLSLTNLLDERGNRFALGSPFQVDERNQITPMRPRTIRIGFDLVF